MIWARPVRSRYRPAPSAGRYRTPHRRSRHRHRRFWRPRLATVALLGTAGGLVLVLRHDPLTGLALRPEAAAAARTSGLGAEQAQGLQPGVAAVAVQGKVATTIFGSVQVEVTVQGRRIVAAKVVRAPEDGGRQGRLINARAMPILAVETIRAQGARIDGVSGATYSSAGYKESLQSAIDAAHLV
jgi:uncharacterized protein with FMN-binding domain